MADGWMKMHRKMCDNWIWQDNEPFDKRSAWIDMLLMANYADNKMLFNGEFITVKKGQFITSVRKLSNKWMWSTNKTYRFLKLLIDDGMIIKHSNSDRTLITIVNYENYQSQTNTNENTNETVAEHNKEIKKEKNNISNMEVDLFFEKIWKRYQIKHGKGAVSKTQKAKLYKIGLEQIVRCIERYEEDMQRIGRDKKYWKAGSTFFNNGYIDYLDKNYGTKEKTVEEMQEDKEKPIDLWSDDDNV